MRATADLGRPMMLVDGLGWIWEQWEIVGVEERKSYFMRDGAPRMIEFTVTLRAYGAEYGADGYMLDLLHANPGLADRGPILPAGIEVRLPDRVTAPAVSQIRLWGKEA